MHPVRTFATVAILAIAVVPASAQPIMSAKSGVVANVEGKVLIDNAEIKESVTHFPEVKEGSVLRTEDGRVELMLPPGFMLRMGENGALKMISNRLIDTRVEMQAGSAVVEVDQTKPDFNVTLVLKDGVVTLSKVGVYRFDSEPARLKVFHGTATVQIGSETVLVASGKMLSLAGGAASAEKFDVEQTDSLDNWSQHRAEAMAMANLSGAKYSNDNYSSAAAGNTWIYNPYYGMYTYMPGMGTMCNPFYGSCFYSPMTAYRAFYFGPMNGYGYTPLSGSRGYSPSVFVGGRGTSYTSMQGATGTSSGALSGGHAAGGGGSAGGFSGGHAGGGAAGGGGTGGHGK
jgi:hypothetical protein